jgi:hypothetical protein
LGSIVFISSLKIKQNNTFELRGGFAFTRENVPELSFLVHCQLVVALILEVGAFEGLGLHDQFEE